MSTPNAGVKFCRTCRRWKRLDHFVRNHATRDGWSSKCRMCALTYRRKWALK